MTYSNKLRKDSVGLADLTFQSLTSVGPLLDMIVLVTTAAMFALASMPLSFLLAFIATFLSINTVFQFSKKIASSGGYYSFVGKGLGPRTGLFTGWMYLLYTWMVIPNIAIFFGAIFIPVAFQMITGITLPTLIWLPLSLSLILFVAVMSYWGIKPSLKYSIITGIIEIVIMVIFSVFIIYKSGPNNTLLVFTPRFAPGGFSGVALGTIFGLTSFAGSGTPITLGEEARLPHKTVGRSIIISMVVTGTTIILVAYSLTIGWGLDKISTVGGQLIGIVEARTYLGIAGALLITIFGINSFLNLGLSYFNAGTRAMHSIARDGVLLPRRLSTVSQKHKTPHYAILIATLMAIILTFPEVFWLGAFNAFRIEITMVTVGYLFVHILANAALGPFYNKIRELNILKHIVVPTAASIMFLVTIYYSITPFVFPVSFGVASVAIWALIGIAIVSMFTKEKVSGAASYNILEESD